MALERYEVLVHASGKCTYKVKKSHFLIFLTSLLNFLTLTLETHTSSRYRLAHLLSFYSILTVFPSGQSSLSAKCRLLVNFGTCCTLLQELVELATRNSLRGQGRKVEPKLVSLPFEEIEGDSELALEQPTRSMSQCSTAGWLVNLNALLTRSSWTLETRWQPQTAPWRFPLRGLKARGYTYLDTPQARVH